MSERHGTTLMLKHHEDLEKVAAYVKQQVREKSIEQVGKDLSERKGDDLVGLSIDEEQSRIYWHDYGHHGDHLDFDSIAECVIKVFPEVEMERLDCYGQDVWPYIHADGKWQEYTLWKFVTYISGKGEGVLLEYKEWQSGKACCIQASRLPFMLLIITLHLTQVFITSSTGQKTVEPLKTMLIADWCQ